MPVSDNDLEKANCDFPEDCDSVTSKTIDLWTFNTQTFEPEIFAKDIQSLEDLRERTGDNSIGKMIYDAIITHSSCGGRVFAIPNPYLKTVYKDIKLMYDFDIHSLIVRWRRTLAVV